MTNGWLAAKDDSLEILFVQSLALFGIAQATILRDI